MGRQIGFSVAGWLGVMALAALVPARADILIVQSTVAQLAPGTVLKDDAKLTVPAGQRAVIMLPAGKTRTIRGPFDASVRDLSQGERLDEALWQKMTELITSGGSSAREPGAVRGVGAPASSDDPQSRPQFSWREIPVDANGGVCVEKDARLTLRRSAAALAGRIIVVDITASQRAEVRFDAGAATAPWPAAIMPKAGAFAFLVPDRPMRQIRLQPIQPLPAADETARLLNSQGCLTQLHAWLRGTESESQ